ncbi:MAG: type II secretion system F family protein [Candidatus Wallbacteria bacterium]
MPRFVYTARNFEGKIITSDTEGDSKEAVISKLRERGYFVTNIKEKGKEFQLFQKKVSAGEISIFARQFATMIGAGVPLVRCLTILCQQCENPRFKEIITKVRQDVEAGSNLSKALQQHPKVFNNLFVNLVKAGEAGGILEDILSRLATYLESSEQLKQKVKGAMTYPVVVFSIAILVVIFLVIFVLPTFETIFKDMGESKLPLPTRILLGISGFANDYLILLIIGAIAAFIGIKKFFESERGQRLFDTNILKMPVIGLMQKKVAVAKFTRTLGTLIASGVPILQALEVTADTAGNIVIAEAVNKTRASIREGESISEPLKASNVFPPMVVQMIAVGEETGELDKMLTKIADFYDQEVDTAVKGLTSVIEPLVIVFMGIVIGGIVMAIFMPMLELVNKT